MHEQQNYFPLLRSSSPDRALTDMTATIALLQSLFMQKRMPANMLQEGVRFSYYSKGEPDGYVISLNRKLVKSFRDPNIQGDPAL